MWEHRNEILHRPDHPWKRLDEEERHQDIHSIYTELVSRNIRGSHAVYRKPLQDLLMAEVDYQRQWLEMAKLLLENLPPDSTRQTTLQDWTR